MGSDIRMSKPPEGRPRYVASFRGPEKEWKIAAEAPSREPVDRAAAEMIATVQGRGQAPFVEVWGPSADGSAWEHLASLAPGPGVGRSQETPNEQPQRSAREERLLDRRHQILSSALAGAGLTVMQSEDDATFARLTDAVDEDTIRGVALWLSRANK